MVEVVWPPTGRGGEALEPQPDALSGSKAERRRRADALGLGLVYSLSGEYPRVVNVSGAAAAAGVRGGDRVLAVDDVDVAIATGRFKQKDLYLDLPAAGTFTLILRRPRGGVREDSSLEEEKSATKQQQLDNFEVEQAAEKAQQDAEAAREKARDDRLAEAKEKAARIQKALDDEERQKPSELKEKERKAELKAYRDALGEHAEAWIAEEYPDRLTGYDVATSIRKWLHERNASHLSVCELLDRHEKEHGNSWDLLGGRPPGARGPPVGKADVFISHVQAEHPIDTLLLMRKAHRGQAGKMMCPEWIPRWLASRRSPRSPSATGIAAPERDGRDDLSRRPFQWVDYFSLRQCKPDFDPDEVASLIREIGWTAVNIDRQNSVWDRSFCVLETFASVHAKATLYVRNAQHFQFGTRPAKGCCDRSIDDMDVERNAKTRNPEDKDMINRYISETIGFEGEEGLNQIMAREVHQSFWGEYGRTCVNCFCCVEPCCLCCGCWRVEMMCPEWIPWWLASP